MKRYIAGVLLSLAGFASAGDSLQRVERPQPSSVTVTGLDAVAERRPYQVMVTDDEIVVEFWSKGLIIVVQ